MVTNQSQAVDYRRMLLLALGLTFGLAVIVGQLLRFQVLHHPELQDRASGQLPIASAGPIRPLTEAGQNGISSSSSVAVASIFC